MERTRTSSSRRGRTLISCRPTWFLGIAAVTVLTGLACGGSTTEAPAGEGSGGSAGGAATTDAGGTGGARLDAQIPVDVSADHAPVLLDATSEADAPACAPAPVDAWQPTWRPPKTPQPTACKITQIDSYLDVCRRSYDDVACRNFKVDPANAGCLDCMLTTEDQPQYGAVVIRKSDWSVNTPGCLVLKDGDATATSCGAKLQARQQCEEQACYVPCAASTYAEYTACVTQAYKTVCVPYRAQAVCDDAPKYAACFGPSGMPFEDWMRVYAIMFCSELPEGGPGDAAADAPVDGAAGG